MVHFKKKSLSPAKLRLENLRVAFQLPTEGLENGLRFKVGDKVQAQVGGFVDGVIIKLWDFGNPYRIELEDDEKTNLWGPITRYVRKRPPLMNSVRFLLVGDSSDEVLHGIRVIDLIVMHNYQECTSFQVK